MGKFMIATFLLLGVGFYEMSGGSNFEPQMKSRVVAEAATTDQIIDDQPAVARSNATSLITLNPAITPVSLETTDLAPARTTPRTPNGQLAVVRDTVAAPAPDAPAAVASPILDLRFVAGQRVNMRSGPGTNFNVLDTLSRGAETEVLSVNAEGWAEIRDVQTGQVGWMAERLLSDG